MSDLDQLLRWETSGGTWRVVGRVPRANAAPAIARLEISLCRCDGGEEMDRLTTSESAVLAYVGKRETSEDSDSASAEFRLAESELSASELAD